MRTTGENAKHVRVTCANVAELTAEWASFSADAELAQAERDTFSNRITELEVYAATCGGEMVVMVKAGRILKVPVAAGVKCPSTSYAWAREKLIEILEFYSDAKRLTPTVGWECTKVPDLLEVELLGAYSVLPADLTESESMDIDAICDVQGGIPGKVFVVRPVCPMGPMLVSPRDK